MTMRTVVLAFIFLAMATPSRAAYCVCKPGISEDIMQKAIDYACGAGADCNPIRPNGQCYNPNTMVNHCSYAVNNYYQKKASSGATCDFGGAATLSGSAPSGGCSYSSSSGTPTGTGASGPVTTVPSTSPPTGSGAGGMGTTPTGTTPTGTTPTTTPVSGTGGTGVGGTPTTGTTPTTTSPYGTTPTPSSILGGGVGMGLAPTGSSMDDSSGRIESVSLGSVLAAIMISYIMCWLN